jgi:hypothetical protein
VHTCALLLLLLQIAGQKSQTAVMPNTRSPIFNSHSEFFNLQLHDTLTVQVGGRLASAGLSGWQKGLADPSPYILFLREGLDGVLPHLRPGVSASWMQQPLQVEAFFTLQHLGPGLARAQAFQSRSLDSLEGRRTCCALQGMVATCFAMRTLCVARSVGPVVGLRTVGSRQPHISCRQPSKSVSSAPTPHTACAVVVAFACPATPPHTPRCMTVTT